MFDGALNDFDFQLMVDVLTKVFNKSIVSASLFVKEFKTKYPKHQDLHSCVVPLRIKEDGKVVINMKLINELVRNTRQKMF